MGYSPDQAPVLRAGAIEEEFKAFKAAKAEYLELRELYFNDASDILIDEEQNVVVNYVVRTKVKLLYMSIILCLDLRVAPTI